MLKRTMALLGLTLTIGALLLALGCSGAKPPSNPADDSGAPLAFYDESRQSVVVEGASGRFWLFTRSEGRVELVSNSPAVARITVPSSEGGLWTIVVQTAPLSLGVPNKVYYCNGETSKDVPLPKFGEALYHAVSFVTKGWKIGSFVILRDGTVKRIW